MLVEEGAVVDRALIGVPPPAYVRKEANQTSYGSVV